MQVLDSLLKPTFVLLAERRRGEETDQLLKRGATDCIRPGAGVGVGSCPPPKLDNTHTPPPWMEKNHSWMWGFSSGTCAPQNLTRTPKVALEFHRPSSGLPKAIDNCLHAGPVTVPQI